MKLAIFAVENGCELAATPERQLDGNQVTEFYHVIGAITMTHHPELGVHAPKRSLVPKVLPPAGPGEERIYADDGRIHSAAYLHLGVELPVSSLLIFSA